MSLDVRTVKDIDEFTGGVLAIGQYFGMVANEERMQRFVDLMTLERMHAAWSDGSIVGGAGAFEFNLSVPGGDLPTAGVTVSSASSPILRTAETVPGRSGGSSTSGTG